MKNTNKMTNITSPLSQYMQSNVHKILTITTKKMIIIRLSYNFMVQLYWK